MRKYCIIFLSLFIITISGLSFLSAGNGANTTSTQSVVAENYLRIHIRANDNTDSAQAVKYLVRDELVAYLVPLVAQYESKAQAVEGVEMHLVEICAQAENVLKRQGFSYGARASVREEYFPTRLYGEYMLEAGTYTALIIELGSGQGENWWCVVYPPLCFTSGNGNVIYKSKILEIIKKWNT